MDPSTCETTPADRNCVKSGLFEPAQTKAGHTLNNFQILKPGRQRGKGQLKVILIKCAECHRFSQHFGELTLSLQSLTFCYSGRFHHLSLKCQGNQQKSGHVLQVVVQTVFPPSNLSHKWDLGRRNARWVLLLMASNSSDISSSSQLGLLDRDPLFLAMLVPMTTAGTSPCLAP